jgi:hypothetical protein
MGVLLANTSPTRRATPCSRGFDQHREKLPAYAAALPRVRDGDGELAGDAIGQAYIARDADRGLQPLDGRRRDQGHVAAEIDAGQLLQQFGCKPDPCPEKAVVARFRRQPARELGL